MDAIEYLTAVAVVEAGRAGFEHRVERSSRSEAVYVKVRRGEAWHGLRIGSHAPYYRCSADYAQVLVPHSVEDVARLAEAEATVVMFVREGGPIVADPAETDEALFDAWRRKRHGVTAETSPGTRWRWDEDRLRWVLTAVAGRPAVQDDRLATAGAEPSAAPRPHLSPREESAIRHRLNARAAWSHEERLSLRG